MTVLYIALLIGSIVACLASRGFSRGVKLLALIQALFWVNILYWDFSAPFPFLFTAICDALVVAFIFKFGAYKWEEKIMFIFVLSILTSLFFSFLGAIEFTYEIHAYSWALYILNWAAVLIIGTASGFKRKGRDDFGMFDYWDNFFGVPRTVKKETRDK